MAHIVVVDDEADLAQSIATRLRSDAHTVDLAADGPSAVRLIHDVAPDLVVLDLMLPGFDGLEVCRRIQMDRPTPVIMLTAKGSETDRVVGLELGADDYLCKPFSMRELAARVQAVLRRRNPAAVAEPVLRAPGVTLDVARRRVWALDVPVDLTAMEFDLLRHLLARRGGVCSRGELLIDVWGYRDGSGPRTVDTHVRSIRRKVGTDVIRTVHGIGYAAAEPT